MQVLFQKLLRRRKAAHQTRIAHLLGSSQQGPTDVTAGAKPQPIRSGQGQTMTPRPRVAGSWSSRVPVRPGPKSHDRRSRDQSWGSKGIPVQFGPVDYCPFYGRARSAKRGKVGTELFVVSCFLSLLELTASANEKESKEPTGGNFI